MQDYEIQDLEWSGKVAVLGIVIVLLGMIIWSNFRPSMEKTGIFREQSVQRQ